MTHWSHWFRLWIISSVFGQVLEIILCKNVSERRHQHSAGLLFLQDWNCRREESCSLSSPCEGVKWKRFSCWRSVVLQLNTSTNKESELINNKHWNAAARRRKERHQPLVGPFGPPKAELRVVSASVMWVILPSGMPAGHSDSHSLHLHVDERDSGCNVAPDTLCSVYWESKTLCCRDFSGIHLRLVFS